MEKGFTLIEVLIYIAIIGIVVTSFITFSLSISETKNKNYVIQEVHANSRVALNLISQKIRGTQGVVNPTEGDTSNTLVLDIPDTDDNLTFNVEGNVLNITEGTAIPLAITSDEVKVTNLVFSNLTPTGERANIMVEITVEYNNAGTDIEYTYSQNLQTAVSLRQ